MSGVCYLSRGAQTRISRKSEEGAQGREGSRAEKKRSEGKINGKKRKTGREENRREEIRWGAKKHGGAYREESKDERERRRAEAFLIYHLCTKTPIFLYVRC